MEDGEVAVNLLTAKSRVAPISKPKKQKKKKKPSQKKPEDPHEEAEQKQLILSPVG